MTQTKKINAFLAFLFISLFTIASCNKDKKDEQLPNEIKSYVSTYFPKNKIEYFKKDVSPKVEYNVHLSENICLDFNKSYNVVSIKTNNFKLPISIFPQKITDYIKLNYPLNWITDWEIDDNKHEVELNNGLELHFDMEGNFIKVSNEDDIIVPAGEIPLYISNYTNEHFPLHRIVKVYKDTEDNEYEVIIDKEAVNTELVKLTFDMQLKKIIEIESKHKLPASVIPAAILSYVTSNYPQEYIICWELETKHQEIKLNNGVELKFDLNGNFISIDNDDDIIVPNNDLPTYINEYITQHFHNYSIIQAINDIEDNEYEITIEKAQSNGERVKLTFSISHKKVIEIKSKHKIPDSVIPNAILSYVKANYAQQYIIEWELETKNQEIKLNNGLELIFDLEGNFLYIDTK